MKLYNLVSELEKELSTIELRELKPEDKGLLVLRIEEAFYDGELEDPNITVSSLGQIALSLIPVPTEPLEVIQGRKIYIAYPWRDREIVLAEWGNQFVTWWYWREKDCFENGHYFHQEQYGGSRVNAYLMALDDFRKRFW